MSLSSPEDNRFECPDAQLAAAGGGNSDNLSVPPAPADAKVKAVALFDYSRLDDNAKAVVEAATERSPAQ